MQWGKCTFYTKVWFITINRLCFLTIMPQWHFKSAECDIESIKFPYCSVKPVVVFFLPFMSCYCFSFYDTTARPVCQFLGLVNWGFTAHSSPPFRNGLPPSYSPIYMHLLGREPSLGSISSSLEGSIFWPLCSFRFILTVWDTLGAVYSAFRSSLLRWPPLGQLHTLKTSAQKSWSTVRKDWAPNHFTF